MWAYWALQQQGYLPSLLHKGDLGPGALAAGLAIAFGLGAAHALSPGHGKTIVAAYLVGSRGTMKHAALLGATVTFTHTISVFALGLGTLLLSAYIVPEKIIPALATISGLSIVAVGTWLFWKRWRAVQHARQHRHGQAHEHHHGHGHGHHHHHHHAPDEITIGGLIALGASGGLAPCPSALVLLLSAIALNRVALGLALLTSFSLGLAGVLVAIGAAVLYARRLVPDALGAARSPAFRWVPVASAGIIVCVGVLMTGVALGWWRPAGFGG